MNALKFLMFLMLAFFALLGDDVTTAALADVDAAGISHGKVLSQSCTLLNSNEERFRRGEA